MLLPTVCYALGTVYLRGRSGCLIADYIANIRTNRVHPEASSIQIGGAFPFHLTRIIVP